MKGSTIMDVNGMPKIHLPGEEKFQSYKTSLQDYCHKKKLTVPQYLAEKESNGLLGTVSFGTNYVKCAQISGSMKEADSRAAYEALQQLGYLQGHNFEVQRNQLKRKDDGVDAMETNAKQIKPGTVAPITSKSHLNQIAQKKKLGTPSYNTVTVNGGFFSTVTIGENQFKSMCISTKRKDAEQDAAQVALEAVNIMQLSQVAVAPPPLSPSNVQTKTSVQTKQIPPPVGMKNRLQEHCQKGQTTLPVYETQHNDSDKTYQAIVTVNGNQYYGVSQKGKKPAEASAAEVALVSLGLI